MSKLTKKTIQIKEGIKVDLEKDLFTATGLKGSLSLAIPEGVLVKIDKESISVAAKNEKDKSQRALCGLTWANIKNTLRGVEAGFEKRLELVGVGYRAQASGNSLTLSLGFSHPIVIKAPEEINFSVAENIVTVSGVSKAIVGDIAAKVRAVKPPEPYKGKGIKYVNERIRRKAGKAAKAIGGVVK